MLPLTLTLLPLLIAALSATALPQCCQDSNGNPYSDCTCLRDNAIVSNQLLAADQTRRFHWRLSNLALISMPDADRFITFELAPCSGSVQLLVNGVSAGFPSLEASRWRGNNVTGYPQSIRVRLDYAEYFVTVFAAAASNFTVAAYTATARIPVPGASGNLTVEPKAMGDINPLNGLTMKVTFTAGPGLNDSYAVLVTEHPTEGSSLCRADRYDADSSNCIVTSVCGVDINGRIPAGGEFAQRSPNELHTVEVHGLTQGMRHSFAVLQRNADGFVSMYKVASGTPRYERVTKAADDSVLIYVGVGAAALFVVLAAVVVWAKSRLRNAYKLIKV